MVSIAVATALGVAVPAYAQSASGGASAGGAIQLNEVIVTAQRVQQRLQDVPISMTVLNQQQLSGQAISNSEDLAAVVPSMSVDTEFGSETASFSIRGFQQALSTTPSVAVYFADAVVPRGGNVGEPTGSGVAPGSFFDLQNVQVLKGPQGTLFGFNTDGGAVLLVPKRPTSEFGGYGEFGFGNYGMKEEQGVLNLPVTPSFRLRLGVNHETRDGYLNNISGVGPAHFGDLDYTAARLSALLDIGDSVENYTVASFNRAIDGGPAPQLFACNPATGAGATICPAQLAYQQTKGSYAVVNVMPSPESYLRQYQVVNTTTWEASSALTVKNIANYGKLVTVLDSSLFGAFIIPTPVGVFPLYASSSYPTGVGADTTNQYTWSDEVQLRGLALDDKFTWQGGAYIMHSGPDGLTGTLSPNFLTCTDISSVASLTCSGAGVADQNMSAVHYNDHAAYVQGTYALLPKLKLTGGARYTWDDTTSTINEINYAGFGTLIPSPWTFTFCTSTLTTLASNCFQRFNEDSSAPTFLLDLEYSPTQNLMIFGKYSRGYRQGGVATFVADGYHVYGPEHVNDYEIGEKASFSGRVSGAFDVTGFYDDLTNQQLLAGFTGPLVAPSSGIVNAGKSRILGLEVDSSLQPVRPLSLYLSYTYLNTKLQSALGLLPPGGAYNQVLFPAVPGGELPFSPKNKFTLGANLQLPVPDNVGSISVGANYTYTSSFLVSQTAQPYGQLPAYGLLGANASWNEVFGSIVDLQFFATNLTNKVYYSDLEQLYNSPFGIAGGYIGQPRMYGARIRVRFGQ